MTLSPFHVHIYWYSHCSGLAYAAISRRDCLTAGFPVLWLFQCFCSLFCDVPWAQIQELWCRCSHWDRILQDLLVSALCPAMVFCGGLHLLQRSCFDAGGGCTYLRSKDRMQGVVRNYAGLTSDSSRFFFQAFIMWASMWVLRSKRRSFGRPTSAWLLSRLSSPSSLYCDRTSSRKSARFLSMISLLFSGPWVQSDSCWLSSICERHLEHFYLNGNILALFYI